MYCQYPLNTTLALMAKTVTVVHPFFKPGAPPCAMHLLTSEIEFLPAWSTTILTQELPHASTRQKVEFAKLPRKQCSKSTPLHSLSASLSEDDIDSDNKLGNSTESCDSDDGLIPKPPGEAGRPKRGGYNPELELGWDSRRYHKLRVSAVSGVLCLL